MGNASLTSITFPKGIKTIEHSFLLGTGLVSIEIPDSVTKIDFDAFKNCSSLTSITLGNNVTEIAKGAFDDCDALTDVYFDGTEEEWNALIEKQTYVYLKNATLHCISSEPDSVQ